MIFRRNILRGERYENYKVEILILVCPNRTCKKIENLSAVIVYAPGSLRFEIDLLTRQLIHLSTTATARMSLVA